MAPPIDPLGSFRVHYPDEREPVDVRLNGKAVVEAERRWPGRSPDGTDRYPPNEGVHYMVWIALGQPCDDFDTWLDEGVILEVAEDQPVPTRPVVGVA